MTIRQMRMLVAISECRQFTLAAKKLRVTQSTLSKQMTALEKELSIQLFEQKARRTFLTPEGAQVLLHVRRILKEYDAMLEEKELAAPSRQKQISIGAVPVLNQYGITDALLQFEKERPGVSIRISETATADIISDIDDGRIDIGIIRTLFLRDNCYNVYPLIKDDYVALVSEQHRLSGCGTVSIDMFSGDRFLLMGDPYYTVFYRKIFADCKKEDLSVEYTDMRLETIKAYVRQNIYVTLMPRHIALYHAIPGVKILYLENSPCLYLAVISRKDENLPSAAAQLIRFLLERYPGVQEGTAPPDDPA